MAIVKTYNQQVDAYGGSDVVQSLTSASTGTAINRHGTTVLDTQSTGFAGFSMQTPVAGVHKVLIVTVGTTDAVNIETNADFLGQSTGNTTLAFSTTAGTASVHLVGASTTQWAIVSQTTGVSVA